MSDNTVWESEEVKLLREMYEKEVSHSDELFRKYLQLHSKCLFCVAIGSLSSLCALVIGYLLGGAK